MQINVPNMMLVCHTRHREVQHIVYEFSSSRTTFNQEKIKRIGKPIHCSGKAFIKKAAEAYQN